MSAGAAATTVYSVETHYKVVNLSDSSLGRYTRATHEADRATRGLRSSTTGLGASTRYSAMAFPLIGAGIAAAGIAGAIAKRTFHSLNEELHATNQLAAQVNISARFSADPVENFNRSLGASRVLVRGLARDAATLPGDFADLQGIANSITIPIARAGGTLRDVRNLTSRIALAAPVFGQSPAETANQARRILLGNGLGDNRLFQSLMAAPGSSIHSAKSFQAMAPERQLKTLNYEFARLTDNPIFRTHAIRDLDTQLGNLSDHFFSSQGIFGRLLAGPFDNFLGVLVRVNRALDQFADSRLFSILTRFVSPTAGPLSFTQRDELLNRDLFSRGEVPKSPSELSALKGWRKDPAIGLLINDRALEIANQVRKETGLRSTTSDIQASAKLQATGEVLEAIRLARQAEKDQDKKFNIPKTNVTQNFTIHLNLKSDDSPEAIAVKVQKGMAKFGRFPTTTGWAVNLVPSP